MATRQGPPSFTVYVFIAALAIAVLTAVLRLNVSKSQNSLQRKPATLNFRPSNEGNGSRFVFKILQLADLHLGEAEDMDWGPEQDFKSARVIRRVIQKEQPDLVVLSGDQLTANNIDNNATVYYRQLISVLQTTQPNIQWCMIFGNHDDSDLQTKLANGTIISTPAKTKRKDLIKLDMSYKNSWTNTTPGLFGTSNYMIPLFLKNNPVVDIYLFDSGGGSLPEIMQDNQVDWFRNTSKNGRPAVAFQHIPSNLNFRYNAQNCTGFNGDGGVAPLENDPGILDALAEHDRVYFVAVGHNHGNDYCCEYSEHLSICFGRHSGYGGYGTWDRGARVYELELEKKKSTNFFSWRSWVRLESGEIIDHYPPMANASNSSLFREMKTLDS